MVELSADHGARVNTLSMPKKIFTMNGRPSTAVRRFIPTNKAKSLKRSVVVCACAGHSRACCQDFRSNVRRSGIFSGPAALKSVAFAKNP